MNPLDIPRKAIKDKGKRAAPSSSSSSSSSNPDKEPSFLQFYEELSNDEDLTDAQKENKGMFKCLNRYFHVAMNLTRHRLTDAVVGKPAWMDTQTVQGRIRIADHRRIPGGAVTREIGNSDDDDRRVVTLLLQRATVAT
ncbi:hypothetical protein Tco_0914337 [Tanacetum coccineum]